MIEIKILDVSHKKELASVKNEPFALFGRLIPSFEGGKWSYEILLFPKEEIREDCFPEADYDSLSDGLFIGAFQGDSCVGLALLRPGSYRYLYLENLKVLRPFRKQGIGRRLISKAREVAKDKGYAGLYTYAQDNNLGACLFYLRNGFEIGGFDTEIYRHTPQEGKADITFYSEIE